MNKYSHKNRRAVVLGGSGFIGRGLTPSLEGRGYEVAVIDRRPPAGAKVQWIEADARDLPTVAKALGPGDVLVHLFHSSIPVETMKDPDAESSENVVPFMELVSRVSQMPLALFVYSSTGGQIYGPAEEMPIPESHPCRPISPYGKAKLAMEEFTRTMAAVSKLPYLILRIANPYGPYQELTNRHGVVPHLFRSVLRQTPFTAYGAGEAVRDYIYIEDAAEAIGRLIAVGARDQAVNIGTGVGTTLADLIALVEKVSGGKVEVEDAPLRPSDIRKNVLDVRRLKKLTGFAPHVGLEDGLRRTWEYMKTHEKT